MKKLYSVCTFLLIVTLSACTTYNDEVYVDNLSFYYSKTYQEAFVGAYLWDGTVEGQTFSIPDNVESYPITSLGGYVGTGLPTPFAIMFPETYGIVGSTNIEPNDEDLYYQNGYELHILVFRVKLGVNIREARNVDFFYYFHEKEDLTKVLYKVYYYFEVDSNNPHIYDDEGKLYVRESNELLEGLEYQDS